MSAIPKEDRHTIPPNFSVSDLKYAVGQGAVYHHSPGHLPYITEASSEVIHRLNMLWAEDSTSK